MGGDCEQASRQRARGGDRAIWINPAGRKRWQRCGRSAQGDGHGVGQHQPQGGGVHCSAARARTLAGHRWPASSTPAASARAPQQHDLLRAGEPPLSLPLSRTGTDIHPRRAFQENGGVGDQPRHARCMVERTRSWRRPGAPGAQSGINQAAGYGHGREIAARRDPVRVMAKKGQGMEVGPGAGTPCRNRDQHCSSSPRRRHEQETRLARAGGRTSKMAAGQVGAMAGARAISMARYPQGPGSAGRAAAILGEIPPGPRFPSDPGADPLHQPEQQHLLHGGRLAAGDRFSWRP